MKKLPVTALILMLTLFMGYGQDNNGGDDVYYQDDQNAQPAPDQNYSDQNYTDDQSTDQGAPTYQTFYDQLSPYGTWVNYPGYGYCWVPNNQDPNFSPYVTNGHWVYTDLGWTWVSDFAWGWGPFHYGRWFDDPSYGWMWLPGYDWAPAWVIWGDYGGYYGWACLGPHDVLSPHFRPDRNNWHFIDHRFMGSTDFGSHIMRSDDVVAHNIDINTHINIISHANTYHQSVFFSGPKVEDVEKVTGHPIERAQINNVHDPAQTKVNGNQINIYRPNIVRNNTQQATPNKVVNSQDFRPTNPRPAPAAHNNNTQQAQHQNNFNAAPTPPRQSSPQPQLRQNNTQSQPQRQQYSAPSQPQRTFVPSSRPASYSPPASRGGGSFGGGGASHGGGGGRR